MVHVLNDSRVMCLFCAWHHCVTCGFHLPCKIRAALSINIFKSLLKTVTSVFTLYMKLLSMSTVLEWCNTGEPYNLERPPHWLQNVVCQARWSLVTGSVTLYIEMQVLLPKLYSLSRRVVSHGSALSRWVSLYKSNE